MKSKHKKLSEEQKEFIIEIIDDWYLKWKTKMTNPDELEVLPTHNLGFAKEELKAMVWNETNYTHSLNSAEDYFELLSKCAADIDGGTDG